MQILNRFFGALVFWPLTIVVAAIAIALALVGGILLLWRHGQVRVTIPDSHAGRTQIRTPSVDQAHARAQAATQRNSVTGDRG